MKPEARHHLLMIKLRLNFWKQTDVLAPAAKLRINGKLVTLRLSLPQLSVSGSRDRCLQLPVHTSPHLLSPLLPPFLSRQHQHSVKSELPRLKLPANETSLVIIGVTGLPAPDMRVH